MRESNALIDPAARRPKWRPWRPDAVTKRNDIHRLADEELMNHVREGNPRAFETIYDRHGAAAYGLAYRMVGDRVIAEDVTQEAFLSIWRSRQRYDAERGSVRSWILSVVHHRALDALRHRLVHDRRRAAAEGLEQEQEAPERTDSEFVRREEARTVRAALGGLPQHQVEVITLAYFGGFSHSQIAQLLDMPVGTVKGRMRLGLDKLRRELASAA